MVHIGLGLGLTFGNNQAGTTPPSVNYVVSGADRVVYGADNVITA